MEVGFRLLFPPVPSCNVSAGGANGGREGLEIGVGGIWGESDVGRAESPMPLTLIAGVWELGRDEAVGSDAGG